MSEFRVFSPLPRDVEDQTLLTRSVAQGIYSSLEPRRSEIYFEEAKVDVIVRYDDDSSRPGGKIGVRPDLVCIAHSADPFVIAFDEERQPKARHVRWVVHGLAESDRLVIRPKEDSPEFLFNYLGGSALEIRPPHNSITSGLPFIPHFETLPKTEYEGKTYAVWQYNVEVWRGRKKIIEVDPEIYLEGDYNH